MPEPANSYAKLPSQHQTFYDRTLLERMIDELVFVEHGQTDAKSIPKNSGDTINLRRFNSLPVPTDSLVEGVTPAGRNLSITQITAVVKQEGDFVMLTDKIDMLGLDPVVTETVELQGEQAAETLDTRVRDIIFNGTNVYYIGGGVARNQVAVGDVFTGTDVRRARQIMARNSVKKIGGSYIGFIHPDGAYDLKGHAEWREPNLYAGSKKIFNGEIGELYGIRWIENNMCPIWVGEGAGGVDVYGSLVIGGGAYGVVDVAGSSKPESIVKPLGSGDDPLNQRSTVGWKALMTAVRLQELALMRIEHSSGL